MGDLIPCVRCQGTSHVPRDNLHEGEVHTRIGERRVFEHTDDEHACPTCAPYGPFGMVPLAGAVEGSLIGAKDKTEDQLLRERFYDWMMNQ